MNPTFDDVRSFALLAATPQSYNSGLCRLSFDAPPFSRRHLGLRTTVFVHFDIQPCPSIMDLGQEPNTFLLYHDALTGDSGRAYPGHETDPTSLVQPAYDAPNWAIERPLGPSFTSTSAQAYTPLARPLGSDHGDAQFQQTDQLYHGTSTWTYPTLGQFTEVPPEQNIDQSFRVELAQIQEATSKKMVNLPARQALAGNRQPKERPSRTRRDGASHVDAKTKTRQVREVGACWRCRKYKKPVGSMSRCILRVLSFVSVGSF